MARKRALVVAITVASASATACGGGHATSPAALASRLAPVHSLTLTVRRSPRVLATCGQARRLTAVRVVCPPLVPADGVIADRDLYGAEGALRPGGGRDFYLLTFNNGDNPGHIHWIVGAGRGRTVEQNLFDPRIWVAPGRVRRLGTRRYGRWAVSFYRFPPYPSGGELGGHDLALAVSRGTTYFVSIHGRTHHDADAAMLVSILGAAASPG